MRAIWGCLPQGEPEELDMSKKFNDPSVFPPEHIEKIRKWAVDEIRRRDRERQKPKVLQPDPEDPASTCDSPNETSGNQDA